MNPKILDVIENFSEDNISQERKNLLHSLSKYIYNKWIEHKIVNINFICTHNSRRSILSQVWAQTMAYYFGINKVYCYSGGTEETAVFQKIVETLLNQGFDIEVVNKDENSFYAIKYDKNNMPILGFSKTYNHFYNPVSEFCAVMTCSSAEQNCPFIAGSDFRIPIQYDDPKLYDETDVMDAKYMERSFQIAQEMWYVFKTIK